MSAHPFRWLAAAMMLAFAVQPGVLPHPPLVQAVIGGLAAAQGYGLAALVGVLGRKLGLPRKLALPLTPIIQRRAQLGAGVATAGLVGAAAFTAHAGQVRLAAATRMTGPTLLTDSVAVAAAVLVAIGVVALVAGVRKAVCSVARRPRQTAALAVVPALLLAGCAAPPTHSLGGSLGIKGEQFIHGTPDAASISALTGRPAMAPIRIYVGRSAAATANERATMAVNEIERAGGFDRSAVLIDVPTGSGWVNPSATSALERVYGGNLTTVVMQYAASPSWLAYLRGGEGVQASVRAQTDAIGAEFAQLPPGHRPRLLVYGESLGAWGGLRAYPNDGIVQHTDGALWVGVPGGLPAGHLDTAAQHVLVHPDDPVPSWSPRLIVHSSPTWPRLWLPIVSFWQATGDVVSVPQTPEGFGHKYGSELVGAWQSVLKAGQTRANSSASRPAM